MINPLKISFILIHFVTLSKIQLLGGPLNIPKVAKVLVATLCFSNPRYQVTAMVFCRILCFGMIFCFPLRFFSLLLSIVLTINIVIFHLIKY